MYYLPFDPNLGEEHSLIVGSTMEKELSKYIKKERFENLEWGVLYEFKSNEIKTFLYMEMPFMVAGIDNFKLLPAGDYECIQIENNRSQIANTPKLFPELFKSEASVIAIERMLTSEKFKIADDTYELTDFRMEIRAIELQ